MTAAASSVASARATIDQARADLAAALARQTLAALGLRRARTLEAGRAIPAAEADARRAEADAADAAVTQARARLIATQAALAGAGGEVTLAQGRVSAARTADEQLEVARAGLALAEARVQQAESALTLAELDLSYTTVKAPRRGVVSRRSVEAGQLVGPDRPLLAIVPQDHDDLWVVANFKEDQLADMHPGDRAVVRLDTYGRRRFAAHVDSIAGGTGARFALLPPDNATGNFIKVVQRVPVLLRLDVAPGLALRPGMSADVTVRVSPR
jgi:membrane fusion protein (multidrug efflux system)